MSIAEVERDSAQGGEVRARACRKEGAVGPDAYFSCAVPSGFVVCDSNEDMSPSTSPGLVSPSFS